MDSLCTKLLMCWWTTQQDIFLLTPAHPFKGQTVPFTSIMHPGKRLKAQCLNVKQLILYYFMWGKGRQYFHSQGLKQYDEIPKSSDVGVTFQEGKDFGRVPMTPGQKASSFLQGSAKLTQGPCFDHGLQHHLPVLN